MKTYAALLLQHNTELIPLADIADLFGLDEREARRRAVAGKLPVPALRLGSQKAPWIVRAEDLARYVDPQTEQARADWRRAPGKPPVRQAFDDAA